MYQVGVFIYRDDNSASINVFEFPDQLSEYQFSQEALSSMSYVLAVGTRDCIIWQDMLLTAAPSNLIKTASMDKAPHQSSICCRIVVICYLEGRHNFWQLDLFINHHATSVRSPVTTQTSVHWAEVLQSFPGGLWFKFRHADKLIWVLIIVVFLSTFCLVPRIISRKNSYISSPINYRQILIYRAQ